MSKIIAKSLVDCSGYKYWILFTHGMFHEPLAVIDDHAMRQIAERVIGNRPFLPISPNEIIALGRAAAAYRKKHKMTQRYFAKRMGISRVYLSCIERGEANNISIAVYNAIVKAIEVGPLPDPPQENEDE